MSAPAGLAMLTIVLAVAGILFRTAIRSDATIRRRYPPQRPEPQPLPRDPRVRSGTELRDLFAEPKPRTPAEPEDAVPSGYNPRER